MRIQLISDLHLNHSNIRMKIDKPDVLVIAGDMSPHPEETADWIEKNVAPEVQVIFVPGNHEYEQSNVFTYDKDMEEAFAHLENVVLLQNKTKVIGGVRFLGTTLWTDFAAYDNFGEVEDIKKNAAINICDFQMSFGRNGLFTPSEASELHSRAKEYLKKEINTKFDGKTVVITHFLPSPKCVVAKYIGSPLNPYFACNVEHLMPGVDVWMHGHTHDSANLKIGDTQILCNPRGYSSIFNLSENHKWNGELIVDVG